MYRTANIWKFGSVDIISDNFQATTFCMPEPNVITDATEQLERFGHFVDSAILIKACVVRTNCHNEYNGVHVGEALKLKIDAFTS